MHPSNKTQTDVYSDFIKTTMPNVSLTEPLHDVKELSSDELVTAAMALRKYPRVLSSFVEGPHTASCTHFSHSNWDRHFAERLNRTIESISLEKFNNRHYPAEKLVWFGWSVLTVYHLNEERNKRFLSAIVKKLMGEKLSEKIAGFFDVLCEKKDELLLPLTLFEEIVTTSPSYIEIFVIGLLHDLHSKPPESSQFSGTEVLFERPSMKSWLKSCSQSSKIFQIFMNITNSLLLHSKGSPSTVTFVQEFHLAVRKLLPENSSIAALYPLHLQALIVHLDKGPEYHSINLSNAKCENILELLMDGLTRNRNEYLCLISHFPPWIPKLYQYAITQGEARVFSNSFLEEDLQIKFERLVISQDVEEKCVLVKRIRKKNPKYE